MITLHSFERAFGTFSSSPFCTKAALLLTYSGQAWQRQDVTDFALLGSMPHRKLPVIDTPDLRIGDSDSIRLWLETQGTDFYPGLSQREKAQGLAIGRMAEYHLQQGMIYARWGDDVIWPEMREILFATIPQDARLAVADKVRADILAGLDFSGISRYSDAERATRLDQDLKAITQMIDDGPFMMGDQVTAADFSVMPILEGLATMPLDRPLTTRIQGDAALMSYIDRVKAAVPLPD